MFFARRSTQEELLDSTDMADPNVVHAFRELDRLNRFFRFSHVFETSLPAWLGPRFCGRLDILDGGAAGVQSG